MQINKEALKLYWRGYRAAKSDCYECGRAYAEREYAYASMGETFAKGYKAYLIRTAKDKA